MNRWVRIICVVFLVAVVVGIGAYYYLRNDSQGEKYPLAEGEEPVLIQPIRSFDNLSGLTPYRTEGFDLKHYGIDWILNGTTLVYSPVDAIVANIEIYHHPENGFWQINILLQLNEEWMVELYFEPWAQNETAVRTIYEGLQIKVGDLIAQDDYLGTNVLMGEDCIVHISVRQGDAWKCPYQYFSDETKAQFDVLFAERNTDSGWGITQPCN